MPYHLTRFPTKFRLRRGGGCAPSPPRAHRALRRAHLFILRKNDHAANPRNVQPLAQDLAHVWKPYEGGQRYLEAEWHIVLMDWLTTKSKSGCVLVRGINLGAKNRK